MTPAHTRLTAKLAEIGLTDTAEQTDFAAWLSGLRAPQLPNIALLSDSEMMGHVKRIEDHWYAEAFVDEWRKARAQEAADSRSDTEMGDFLIRDGSF